MKIAKIKILLLLSIVFVFAATGNINAQADNWTVLGNSITNGTNGNVYAVTSYNGNKIVAGGFTQAGGINARNIASWNGTSWSALGNGIGTGAGDTVYSLAVYGTDLYAGGIFATASGVTVNNITKWNGSNWLAVTTGTDAQVQAMIVYNSQLIVGGEFGIAGGITANRIATWNGTIWSTVGTGFNTNNGAKVFAFTIYNSYLIAGGRFNTAGGNSAINVASWNGSTWSAMGGGLGSGSERVFSLTVNNGVLYGGGKITVGTTFGIAQWNGSTWLPVSGGFNDEVDALASYKGKLIAGGNFKYANGTTLYVDRIAQFDGVSWQRMLTGMDDKVNALFVENVTDTSLYAGGEFTTAGGKHAYHVAKWSSVLTSTVQGIVRYADNDSLVQNGVAKILRLDVNTQEVIVIDSAVITNGTYSAPRVPGDSTLRVIIYPNDQLNFVPTYYPSTIDWRAATVINPINNLSNINVNVSRITPNIPGQSQVVTVGGYVYLSLIPPGDQPGDYPYNKDGITYFKQGNTFRRFSVSGTTEQYPSVSLPPGDYEVTVFRLGYTSAARSFTVGSFNIDTLNFYLDTNHIIGIENIGTSIPADYRLGQNYPNPFNPSTKIRFSVPAGIFANTPVQLKIYNILGQEAAMLVDKILRPGEYEVTFNAESFSTGVYFYRLIAGDFTETKKMVLIK
jgi:hypothetical protein